MSGEPTRLTRAQVREVDRLAIEEFHIPGIVLMENASRGVVDAAADLWPANGEIGVLCGGGNNGGDGFAIARHLHNRGYHVSVVLTTPPEKLRGDALINWKIIQAMDLFAEYFNVTKDLTGTFILHECAVIVDALFGTGLTRPPGPGAIEYIDACNKYSKPVIAVDVPSGLDCDTGEALGHCVRATRTVTFVAEKAGFANPASRMYTGEVVVGDIGCPQELIARVIAETQSDG